MRIRKLREGRRKIGDEVIEQEDLIDLREVSAKAAEGKWGEADEIEHGECQAMVAEEKNVYCIIEVGEYAELEIPDRRFLYKLLQIV